MPSPSSDPLAPSASTSSSGFADGLGRRALAFDREEGTMLERLVVRPEIAAFEPSLRERLEAVMTLEDERIARPRTIERDPGGALVVVSEFVPGSRLSDLLESSADQGTAPGVDAALGYLLDVLPALCGMHAGAGFAHGTITPARTVLTPAGQVVLLDAIFGGALSHLRYSRRTLWTDFGIATPPSAGAPRLDAGADIAQVALAAVLLVLGRPLREGEYPGGVGNLVFDVVEVAQIRGGASLADGLLDFLQHAFPLPGSRPFGSIDDALIAVRTLAGELGAAVCRRALVDFIQQMESPGQGAAVSLDEGTVLTDTVEESGDLTISEIERYGLVEEEDQRLAESSDELEDQDLESGVDAEIDLDGLVEAPLHDLEFDHTGAIDLSVDSQALEEAAVEEPVLEGATAAWHEYVDRTEGEAPAAEPLPSLTSGTSSVPVSDLMAEPWSPDPEPIYSPPPPAPEAEAPAATVTPQPAAEGEAAPSVRSRRAKRLRSSRARKDRLRSVAVTRNESLAAAASPEPRDSEPSPVVVPAPAPESSWLVPPKHAAVFDQPAGGVQGAAAPPPAAPAISLLPPGVQPAAFNAPAPLPPGTTAPAYVAPRPPAALPAAPPPPRPAPFAQPSRPAYAPPVAWTAPAPAEAPAQWLATVAPQPIGIKVKEVPRRAREVRPQASDVAVYAPSYPAPVPRGGLPWTRIAAAAVLLIVGVIGGRAYWPASGTAAPAPSRAGASRAPAAAPAKVTLPNTSADTGRLEIETQPAGAKVLLDGKAAGESPLTIDSVPAGRHTVTFVSASGSVKRTIRIEAGRTARLDVPIFSGWVGVFAPFVLEVIEGTRTIGTTEEPRLMLSPGRHVLTLQNRELGYTTVQAVEIEPGEVRSITLDPRGVGNLNATPWAEVWLDGKKLGDTPVANVAIPLGTRELVFRHPQLGERRMTVVVKATAPLTVSVDMTKP